MTILFLNLQITRSDIRPHIKWAVSLVIAHGHVYLPQGFVWVCMGSHAHFITPKGAREGSILYETEVRSEEVNNLLQNIS